MDLKMKTVKEVAEITGVSIRTLRYYDEIGLLKPTGLSKANYRLYDHKALERLQQILFFRELEIPLPDIKEILDNPGYDKMSALQMQKALLEKKRNRLNGIIELISDVMRGVNTMSFEAFNEEDIQKILDYQLENIPEEIKEEIIKEHGSIEAYRTFASANLKDEKVMVQLLKWYGDKEKAMSYTREPLKDKTRYQQECNEVMIKLAEIRAADEAETEKELVAGLARAYKGLFELDNARALLLDMAKGYEEKSLQEATDSIYGDGSALYFAKAIRKYYGEE